jgi:hypothetical protein
MKIYIELFIFLYYVIYVAAEYDVLPSISESWYQMGREKFLFTLFCFSLGTIHATHGGVLFFLSGSSLIFAGAATTFKPKRTTAYYVHMAGAIMAIVLSVAALATHGIWWPIPAIIIIALAIRRDDNATWWVEIFSFLFIMMGITQLK